VQVSLGLPTHRTDLGEEFVSVQGIVELAAAAEQAGFAAVFTSDHPAPPVAWLERGGHHTVDPFVVLSAAAAVTTTLRLHTNLFVPAYRHSLIAAKQVASLDRVSGGRLILGVGAGYVEDEFAALGVNFDERNDTLDSSIRRMRQLWSGETVAGVVQLPMPAQPGGPPVWIGGNSRRAMRRAVELGDGWVPMPSPRRAQRALRTPGIESMADLQERLEVFAQIKAELACVRGIDICFMPSGLDMFTRAAPEPDQVVDELHALSAVGVTWATVMLPGETRRDLLAAITDFGTQVLARLDAPLSG
jgi:probable F420-dependent oxidoreductase